MKTQKCARASALILSVLSVLMLLAASVTGCEGVELDDWATQPYEAATGNPETACLLHFVNDPSIGVVYLDDDARLDRRAAKNLILHRDGRDRVSGTGDDNLFNNLSELRHIKWVGDSAIGKLKDHSDDWCMNTPSLPLGDFGGVSFSVYEGRQALRWLNRAEIGLMESELGLSLEVAEALQKVTPLRSLGQLTMIADDTDAFERLRRIANR